MDDFSTVLTIIISILTITGIIFGFIYKFLIKPLLNEFKKLNNASNITEQYTEERKIIFSSLFAVLDGLHQLGANGDVTKMRDKLVEYNINRD